MQNSSKFFCNKSCEYYPCHQMADGKELNCLFCYCPMNPYADCLGTPSYIKKPDGRIIKNCTNCTFPHDADHYSLIINYLKEHIR